MYKKYNAYNTNLYGVCLDQIDAVFPDRSKVRSDHLKENVGEFLVQCNKTLKHNREERYKEVFIIGATNHPESLDPAVMYIYY